MHLAQAPSRGAKNLQNRVEQKVTDEIIVVPEGDLWEGGPELGAPGLWDLR
jgi:hypothetical protein